VTSPGSLLRAVSYNVHECVGTDGVRDLGRVAAVLGELDADVVGLQEVASEPGKDSPAGQLHHLARASGLTPVYGPTLKRRTGEYGNGLLTRLPVERISRHDLSVPGLEPRGVLEVGLRAGEVPLRVLVTHLGLRRGERAFQARAVARILAAGAQGETTVLLADLNEWFPLGTALRHLHQPLKKTPAPRTFPSRLPFLALDRICVSPSHALEGVWAHRTPLSRVASDHLPVVASLVLGCPCGGRASAPSKSSPAEVAKGHPMGLPP
jgi:endonuclease/exonuclease/phosphatase family metal-dependent hydrolase